MSEGNLPPSSNDLIVSRGFRVEAKVPIGRGRDLVMTYIGKCKEERRSDSDDIRQERLMLEGIMARERKGPAAILAEFHMLGNFRVERVRPDSLGVSDIDRLVWMHGEAFPTFPYDFRKKLGIMLRKPESYLMVIVKSSLNDQIYAFSNLELNTLKLAAGSSLCLAEFDNSMSVARSPGQLEVKGLGGVLRVELARLAGQHKVDLCHSESRASLAAINNISYHIGMRLGGALEKHLLISGKSDINYKIPSPFETMNVWYLNREALKNIETECRVGMEKYSPAQ